MFTIEKNENIKNDFAWATNENRQQLPENKRKFMLFY